MREALRTDVCGYTDMGARSLLGVPLVLLLGFLLFKLLYVFLVAIVTGSHHHGNR